MPSGPLHKLLLQVRPALIGVQDIDALCELVDILRLEVSQTECGLAAAAGLAPVLGITVASHPAGACSVQVGGHPAAGGEQARLPADAELAHWALEHPAANTGFGQASTDGSCLLAIDPLSH